MSSNILDKIISISGKPGLFKLLSQTRNGVIAESIMDKEKTSTNSIQHINLLSEIQVYGLVEDFPLIKIFEKISTCLRSWCCEYLDNKKNNCV